MKKIILLLSVFVLVFTSCSSDDDGGSQDPFVGTWKYYKYYEDGVELSVEDCDELTTIVVSSNETYTTTIYEDYGSGCELDYVSSGTWDNLGAGLYSTTDEDGGAYVQEIGFEGNTMYFEETDGGVVYKDVFIRQ
ncbi:lipocalin family protein [Winogradskyella psychrotolerans]|uniref:lipocalin family protein n=1 Tax=Winogradskyella psychrotolerans TaxID=1344585 RepID=UPI001C0717B4|nr:lipocalin family protein [Winogradskyella psychrotolerans]MBU2922649.1 lipocalin family protein [Winogradskyella psychrotolerans]